MTPEERQAAFDVKKAVMQKQLAQWIAEERAARAKDQPKQEPPTVVPRAGGYLAQWERELEAGTRSKTTFDPLWKAACAEKEAEEAEQDKLFARAATCRQLAADIMRRNAPEGPPKL